MKYIHWEPSCSTWMDGWTDRQAHNQAKLIVAVCNFSVMSKISWNMC